MIDKWSGTLTLTEASSRELMRILKKQDAEFMDALFNGKCGFTLKCTDGRSVELVPKADRKTENCSEKPNNCEDEPTWEQVKEYCNKRCLDIVDSALRKKWYIAEPQTGETQDGFYDEYYRDHEEFYEPQTDCAWGRGSDEPRTVPLYPMKKGEE